ncbi:MAG TPA: VWA domain-containing protein [Candidatus Anaerobutyricum stercoris]|uniref:VWA domain-containing protein n=1 Tax=Candidatus Anaerobutyricum stercoris TaxID=2838457 RepID=A0A9D2EIL3_9FIRM|nr:VWA domain-containing protein [Candidatus Anaerobutyricum stercoris]
MPKWIDLNEMDDDDILLKRNRMSRSLVSDEIPAVKADAYEDDFLDAMEPAKKSMTIFFLIDVSGSMKGTKIGSLNGTMEELLPSLIGVGEASTDVKIAIMKFSTDVEWVTPEPVRIEEYQYWNRLEAEGLTFMGDAFLELSKKLSRSSFLNSPSISFAPVIFLLSDGSPNDDWKKGLETLKQNKWFQHGLKIALGIGSKVNMDVLRAFTGNDELAVQAKNADQLRELIKLLAVTSSQIGSRSLALVDNGGGQQSGEEVVAMAKQQVLVEEIRSGTKDILGEAVDLEAVDFDEGW